MEKEKKEKMINITCWIAIILYVGYFLTRIIIDLLS